MAAATQLDVVCPAASLVAETPQGPAVRCGVERSIVSVGENPTSLATFCLCLYTECPTWRAEKERIAARKRQPLVSESEGD